MWMLSLYTSMGRKSVGPFETATTAGDWLEAIRQNGGVHDRWFITDWDDIKIIPLEDP